MLDRLGVLLALLVLAGIPAFAQDPNEINSREHACLFTLWQRLRQRPSQ